MWSNSSLFDILFSDCDTMDFTFDDFIRAAENANLSKFLFKVFIGTLDSFSFME